MNANRAIANESNMLIKSLSIVGFTVLTGLFNTTSGCTREQVANV